MNPTKYRRVLAKMSAARPRVVPDRPFPPGPDNPAFTVKLQGAVAQGRAVLATLGIKLSRKVKKKSEPVKPVATIVPQAA